MSIEYHCPSCGNMLRVPSDNAGREARCPVCQTVSVVPVDMDADAPPPREWAAQRHEPPAAEPDWAAVPDVNRNPFQAPPETGDQVSIPYDVTQVRPHRGGTILALGIASLVCCSLLGIAAWVMANEDLRLMDQGLMDPSGRGTTQTGRILGIIALVMSLIALFLNFSIRVNF